MHKLVKNKVKMTDSITECIVNDLRKVSKNISCAELGRILHRNSYVLVEGEYLVDINDLVAFMQKKMSGEQSTEEAKEEPVHKNDQE